MFKKKYFNTCNIYILLWIFNFVQSSYWNSSVLSLVCFVPMTFMNLYYLFQIILKYHPRYAMKLLILFFLVLCGYGVELWIMNDAVGQDPKSFLFMLFNSLGPIFAFYAFSMKVQLTKKTLRVCACVFLVLAIIGYLTYEQKALQLLVMNKYDEITNNTAYSFVALFPFLFLFYDNRLIQYALIICIMIFVISGMKRGAILISSVLLLWFIFRSMKNASRGQIFLMLFSALVVAIIGIKYVEYLYSTSDYFQYRINQTLEGESSGRNSLYSVYWNHFLNNDNFLQVLFGEGAYHTENILNLKAHNDWLELLIDCGILGVLLYFIYWYQFLKQWISSNWNPLLFSIMGACFCFTFFRTLFSMSFSDMPFSLCMIMGYTFAAIDNSKIILYGKNHNSRRLCTSK